MSFSTELLDCFDILRKRSSTSIDATHAVGSFIKNLAFTHKEAFSKFDEFLQKSRKEYLPKMDYSVASALSAFIEELQIVYAAQSSMVDALLEQRKEIETALKESEKNSKTLSKEGDRIEKGWDTQLEALKKARSNYVKLGKEAQTMLEGLEKKKQDPKVKPEIVSQLSSKAMAAAEKRDQAEQQYKQVLESTNMKMESYYSTEQPTFIASYQKFEEENVILIRNQLSKCARNIRGSNLASVFTTSCDRIDNAINQIDQSADVNNWADANGRHVCIPEPIPSLTYDIDGGSAPQIVTGSGRKPNSTGSSSSSSRPSRAPASIPVDSSEKTSEKKSSHKTSKKSSKSSKTSSKTKEHSHRLKHYDSAKYNITETNPAKIPAAAKKMLKVVEEDLSAAEKDLAAAQKLFDMYSKDPEGRADVESELNDYKRIVEELQFIKSDLSDAANEPATVEVEYTPKATETAGGEGEIYTAAYAYEAANDTELTFSEGDRLTIMQKDEESGWWFARLNGKDGFVPANYMNK